MHIRRNGFTLIEILAVMMIIAVLAAYMVPRYTRLIEKQKRQEAEDILRRMHLGYKRAIMYGVLIPQDDSYKLYNFSAFGGGPLQQKRCFNPDESDDVYAQQKPAYRSPASWYVLGFDMNPNLEFDTLVFSYDFLKPDSSSWPSNFDSLSYGAGRSRTRPYKGDPSFDRRNIGVAWRKTSNHRDTVNTLFPIDETRWVAIDMDSGEIYYSPAYQ